MKIELILAVMNTTELVVEMRPENKAKYIIMISVNRQYMQAYIQTWQYFFFNRIHIFKFYPSNSV